LTTQHLRLLNVALWVLLVRAAAAADDEAGRLKHRITECKYSEPTEIFCDMHVLNETEKPRRVGSIGPRVAQLQDEASTPVYSSQIDLKSADGTAISHIMLFPRARVYYRMTFLDVSRGIRKANIILRYGGLQFADIPVVPFKPASSAQ
jgi:hypothetical protein